MLPGAEPALEEKDLVTINRFASWVGGDATSIKNRVVAASFDVVLERAGHKFYRVADLFRAYGTENQFQRRARVQADEIELRIAESKGDLLRHTEHVMALAAVCKLTAEMCDTLPDVIERDCGAPPAIIVRLEQICDDVRKGLADRMVELSRQQATEVPAPVAAQEPAPATPKRSHAAAGGALDGAGRYLTQTLAAGPRLAAELMAEAAGQQISETSLRRAKAKLGIVARRAGKGWEWALAAQDDQGSQPA